MGIFSGHTEIITNSQVYNLAGPENDRANFLQTNTLASILNGSDNKSKFRINSYLGGPAIKFKSFYAWCTHHKYFDKIGFWTSKLYITSPEDEAARRTVLKNNIDHAPNETIEIANIDIGIADPTVFGEEYLLANNPSLIQEPHNVLEVTDTNGYTGDLIITFDDTNISPIIFTPTNWNRESAYIAVLYYIVDTNNVHYLHSFIYKFNDGNVELDSLFATPTNEVRDYYPFIPFRIDNQSVPERFSEDFYRDSKIAFKRAVDGDYDGILDQIEDNPSVAEIDYAYVLFGVSLNVKDNSCKKYIFNFFEIMGYSVFYGDNQDNLTYSEWETKLADAQANNRPWVPELMSNEVYINSSNNDVMNYDTRISWNYIERDIGAGKYNDTIKRGDVLIFVGSEESKTVDLGIVNTKIDVTPIVMIYQKNNDTYTKLTIRGLFYKNTIYGSKGVGIKGQTALNDTKDSIFIIPLQKQIYESLSIVDSTQMATACVFLMFNSYRKEKHSFFESTIFKVLVVIVVIVINIVSAGTTVGADAGILGLTGSVSSALVSVGIQAAIAVAFAAAVNALAAVVITTIITKASDKLFGDKFGSIIGALASFVAIQGLSNTSSFSIASSTHQLSDPINLLKLTQAAGKGYQGYLKESSENLLEKAQKVIEDSEKRISEIQDQIAGLNTFTQNQLDVLLLSEETGANPIENRDSFLSRSLLNGSDIREISLNMIYNYTDVTINTELAI